MDNLKLPTLLKPFIFAKKRLKFIGKFNLLEIKNLQNIVNSGTLDIELEFDNVGSGLIAKNKLTGFEIAGVNGNFFPANAKIINNTIRVSSRKVKNPKRVRYGWKNYFEATLFNKEGLPASSFQTN